MSTPEPAIGHLRPTHVTVTFTIVLPDKLRRIIFKLIRSSDSQDDSWKINFELDERVDTKHEFDLVIALAVDVDHNDAAAKAQAAATANHGMDADQRAQALVAGDTAKDASTGANGVTVDDAKEDAVAVVTSRSPDSPA